MFIPNEIYYEENISNYELGRFLLKKYKDVPKKIIESHNNILEMRNKENKEFPKMKQNLIIGVRKTHKYVPNFKVSDYLVPYTSSGCTAMCLYCYLVCNYNKCAYLRLFVNREQMLDKIIKKAKENTNLVFEIGSNSDLILENTITNNLVWTIENFAKHQKGYLTFPTKFDMVNDILSLNHNNRVIVRMSVNPNKIISKVELGTSNLEKRVKAINKLADAGYKVGVLIAPIVLIDNWENEYLELIKYLKEKLSPKAQKEMFFELILMTYSYIHTQINKEAFPNAITLLNKELMTGRGRGKYAYKNEVRSKVENFFKQNLEKYFPNNPILYIS